MRRIPIAVARAAAWEATSAERAVAAARLRDRSRGQVDTSAPRAADLPESRRVPRPLLRVRLVPGASPIVARGPPAARWRRIVARWRGRLAKPRRASAKPDVTSSEESR